MRRHGRAMARRSVPGRGELVKVKLPVILLFAGLCGAASGQQGEFAAGRASYDQGEFKKAAAHFQAALQVNPNDAGTYYWAGMSYQMLADIAAPFGHKYNAKARINLTRAMELAPNLSDYRRELFDFLLDSAGASLERMASGGGHSANGTGNRSGVCFHAPPFRTGAA